MSVIGEKISWSKTKRGISSKRVRMLRIIRKLLKNISIILPTILSKCLSKLKISKRFIRLLKEVSLQSITIPSVSKREKFSDYLVPMEPVNPQLSIFYRWHLRDLKENAKFMTSILII